MNAFTRTSSPPFFVRCATQLWRIITKNSERRGEQQLSSLSFMWGRPSHIKETRIRKLLDDHHKKKEEETVATSSSSLFYSVHHWPIY